MKLGVKFIGCEHGAFLLYISLIVRCRRTVFVWQNDLFRPRKLRFVFKERYTLLLKVIKKRNRACLCKNVFILENWFDFLQLINSHFDWTFILFHSFSVPYYFESWDVLVGWFVNDNTNIERWPLYFRKRVRKMLICLYSTLSKYSGEILTTFKFFYS